MAEGSRSSFSSSPVPSGAAAWKRSTRNSDLSSTLNEKRGWGSTCIVREARSNLGLAVLTTLASCGQDAGRSCFITQHTQRAFVLVMRSRAFECLLRLECHRLRGDRDDMVPRTLKVGRDSKPPRNRRSNDVLLVSIDEEMCPLRFQRQQRHVCVCHQLLHQDTMILVL